MTRASAFLLIFALSTILNAQGVYFQVNPNNVFGRVVKSDADMTTKMAFSPFVGLGFGVLSPLFKSTSNSIDINLNYQGIRYKSIHTVGKKQFLGTIPMLEVKVLHQNDINKPVNSFFSLGASVSYSGESLFETIFGDSVNNTTYTLRTRRHKQVPFFVVIGSGIWIRRTRRDILLSLQYNQGLNKTIEISETIQSIGSTRISRIEGRDSQIILQIKFLLSRHKAGM